MRKLTAKKCRERIASLKRNRRVFGLAMDSELYLKALEIALPVLEQQEKGESGWLHWNGEMALPPVANHVRVEVKRRNGDVADRRAESFAWRNSPVKSGFDIIAYRVVEQERERGGKE